MRAWRILYWFVAGMLIGVGLITIPVIGWFILVPAGLILTIMRLARLGRDGVWALAVGFGTLPVVLSVRAILIAQAELAGVPPCPSSQAVAPAPGVPSGTCGGPIPTVWYVFLAGYAVIALAGLAWPLIQLARRRRA
jgi:hypothetical protein